MEQMNMEGLEVIPVDYKATGLPDSVQIFKPAVYMEGALFCCILGPDLQEGVFGCGQSVPAALEDWDQHLQKRAGNDILRDETSKFIRNTIAAAKKEVGKK